MARSAAKQRVEFIHHRHSRAKARSAADPRIFLSLNDGAIGMKKDARLKA
jgi:hypothetical protein